MYHKILQNVKFFCHIILSVFYKQMPIGKILHCIVKKLYGIKDYL